MSREAMQQALEALELVVVDAKTTPNAYEAQRQAIAALRAALAEQDDDLTAAWMAGAAEERKRAKQAQPVACHVFNVTVSGRLHEWGPTTFAFALKDGKHALYTSPPAPQPLTDEELDVMWRSPMSADWEHREYGRLVEAEVLKRMGVGE